MCVCVCAHARANSTRKEKIGENKSNHGFVGRMLTNRVYAATQRLISDNGNKFESMYAVGISPIVWHRPKGNLYFVLLHRKWPVDFLRTLFNPYMNG